VLRVLVVNSKTQYYVDKGIQRGTAYEEGRALEDWLNQRHKGKTAQKNLKLHVTFVPVSRDELTAALLEGRGDIAIAALTITPERQKDVDFSRPVFATSPRSRSPAGVARRWRPSTTCRARRCSSASRRATSSTCRR